MQLTSRKPLRLWPGVIAAVLLVLVRFALPLFASADGVIFGMGAGVAALLGSVIAALAIYLWWILFSRAPWSERLGALALMIVAVAATRFILDESVAGAGMGRMFPMFAMIGLSVALVVWAVASRRLSAGPRRATMIATILLASAAWALVRTGGITGDGASDLHWRWTPTPEERLLAESRGETLAGRRPEPLDSPPAAAPTALLTPAPEKRTTETANAAPTAATPAAPADTRPHAERSEDRHPALAAHDGERPATSERSVMRAEWPGFRGPNRDGNVKGVRIKTDWSAAPPVELWRRPIGPGWSSFAVAGDLVYTQEQRGEDELVAAYKLTTGEPVWRHRDRVRFYESNGGAGPRGTPTVHNGRVYSVGATGIVNVLDARTGAVVWTRNAASDTSVTVPDWGVTSSPLVMDDVVIVAVSGQLVAYDVRSGDPRWFGPKGGAGYSSPHLVTLDGVPQILLLRGSRTISVAPADGTLLWEHVWQLGVSIVQPGLAPNGDILITVGDAMGGLGVRRLAVVHGPDGWKAEERWTSRGLKPYFNDFVVHKGYAFGFDGSILACIDLADGARKWKGGRYGNGQLVLLPEQDLLLVLSEDGEIVLVSATADQFSELARFPALNAKTWNHPALIRDLLLIRNGEEMAAFRLSLASD